MRCSYSSILSRINISVEEKKRSGVNERGEAESTSYSGQAWPRDHGKLVDLFCQFLGC